MPSKYTISLDSTVLSHSGCIRALINTILGDPETQELGGYKEKVLGVPLVYGIAIHKFLDTMYKTNGHIPTARAKMLEEYRTIPFIPDRKKLWMNDEKHLMSTANQVWTEFCEEEVGFELLKVPQLKLGSETEIVEGYATEINFKIPYYEDEIVKVYLCGTIDRIGKFKNGCYCIRDWKTTGSWEDGYFVQYELSRQLRFYTLAVKLMAQVAPDSVLGKMGQTQFRAMIDGIFLRANPNETVVQSSEAFYYDDDEINKFKETLDTKIQEISQALRKNDFPKQGILTGACEKKFGRCTYWNLCKSKPEIAKILLDRDFVRKPFDPLSYNK